ncbi:Hypothetical predicted protein [Olea europaea subsp. europaea]|uniref:Uncharacterized protein n=1 Tax=Olea europaea subsp. europaea TaxID=158383 RepID=A0A8S0SD53_OLEEU|nr:Hypothetical predicted protein [Olea europaea subsp. europaea]
MRPQYRVPLGQREGGRQASPTRDRTPLRTPVGEVGEGEDLRLTETQEPSRDHSMEEVDDDDAATAVAAQVDHSMEEVDGEADADILDLQPDASDLESEAEAEK